MLHTILQDMLRAGYQMPAPDSGDTVYVDRQFAVVPVRTGAGAFTLTLGQPTYVGLICMVVLDTDGGGDLTLTPTGGYDQAGSTPVTFNDAGDFIVFHSIKKGPSYVWRVLGLDGVSGPTIDTLDITTPKIGGVAVLATAAQLNSARYTKWPMAAFGAWELANDGAQTNGGGIVGDVTETNAAAAFAKAFDASESGGTWGNVAVTNARDGYSSDRQLFPDSPAQTDSVAFGGPIPFAEITLAIEGAGGTPAVYDAAAVLAWEYSDGVNSWASLTLATDSTDTDAADGARSFQQDGALSFVPPSDWASVALDGQTAYWIRAVVQTGKGANMTTSPITVGAMPEHYIVTPTDGFKCPHDGTITDIRTIDQASTLHTGSDVKFIVMDFTTGAHSGELTWAQDQRQDAWGSLTLAVNAGDELGVLVTAEDTGNADPTDVMLELGVTLA